VKPQELDMPGRYGDDHGKRILSVTEILDLGGVRDLAGLGTAAVTLRSLIGTAIHQATAHLDLSGGEWRAVDPAIRERWETMHPEIPAYISAWETFKTREDFIPRLVEHKVTAMYGGVRIGMTLDREGLVKNKPFLIDIKTPKVKEPWWGAQLAGYELGMTALHGLPKERPYRWQRAAVQLFSDGRAVPYHFWRFDDQADFTVFQAALVIAIWRFNHHR